MSSNQEQRNKALGKFDLVDDRMKLTNSLWGGCTRAAFSMGMSDDERMKLIAVNLVTQNQLLLNAVATQTDRIDELTLALYEVLNRTDKKFTTELAARISTILANYTPPPTTITEIMPPTKLQDGIDPDGE